MARPLRIQFENAYYHVTCRGNAGEPIFSEDYDRRKFLLLLQHSAEIYRVNILAFVLMTNHFHLIIKTPSANIQEFMRHFNISYTAFFNKQHGRCGHLFQGRYKSFVIDADAYLLEASRYVHLNPVRIQKGLSTEQKITLLKNYRWSSYYDYSVRIRHPFLSLEVILNYFKGKKERYRDFVESGITLTINPLEKGKGHGIVGDAPFIEKLMTGIIIKPKREQPAMKQIIKKVQPERILQVIAGLLNLRTEEFLQKGHKGIARGLAMEMLYRYGGMNQREIGELMGIDYSAVSVARKRLAGMLEKDKDLTKTFHEIQGLLSQG
ncbi:MAG: transposase [Proteobacteria bacterium]|nr:transposase [Pseudomonadota bacterium]